MRPRALICALLATAVLFANPSAAMAARAPTTKSDSVASEESATPDADQAAPADPVASDEPATPDADKAAPADPVASDEPSTPAADKAEPADGVASDEPSTPAADKAAAADPVASDEPSTPDADKAKPADGVASDEPTPDADASGRDGDKPPESSSERPVAKPVVTTDGAAAPPQDYATEVTRGGRIAFGVAGGVLALGGLALAGVSGLAIVRGRNSDSDLESMLAQDPQGVRPDEVPGLEDRLLQRQDTIAEGRRFNRLAIGTGIPAGLLLGTGIAMIVLAARRPRETRVSPVFTRRMAGLVLRTRF